MNEAKRVMLIQRYLEGPALPHAACATSPEESRDWRPTPDAWSTNEILCHCADSELNAASRLRMLVAEPDPVITGYNQDVWASRLGYQTLPVDVAFSVINATRSWTHALLEMLTPTQWAATGTHTDTGRYTVIDWLTVYADHLHIHVNQMQANVEAWSRCHDS